MPHASSIIRSTTMDSACTPQRCAWLWVQGHTVCRVMVE
jgi:hypothetical protein